MAFKTIIELIKNESWILHTARAKLPKDVFEKYLKVVNKKRYSENFDLFTTGLTNIRDMKFYQECSTHFKALLEYDIKACTPSVEDEDEIIG